jgi:GNAT superfamily N-acetyltransferase
MSNAKKVVFRILFIFNVMAISAAGALLCGCVAGTGGAKEKETAAGPVAGHTAEMVDGVDSATVGSLAQRVDSLRERFMAMPGSHPVPEGALEMWQSLAAEAERLRKRIHADEKLEYLLGELNRIGIFFNAADAVPAAEYYLSACVGRGGGMEERDYRPYLSLAWLNLHQGCRLHGKTRSLLEEAEKRAPDWERPFLSMLWGYYHYSCGRDPARALPFFQTYLAFDPRDERAVKVYRSIRKALNRN